MITVVIADDHTLVREGIRAILEKNPGIRILAEAGDGQQAVELCESLQPDVLLIDIIMPRLNGIQAVERLREANLKTRPIVLSMYLDETLVREVLLKGARGYVLKNGVSEELMLAIPAAMRGETYLSPGVATLLVESAVIQGRGLGSSEDGFNQLSLREREILQLLAEGHTNAEIAGILVLSEKTIEKHRAALMSKLNISNLARLVRIAIKYGLIPLNE